MPYPSKRTDTLVEGILTRLGNGEPLAAICRDVGITSTTWYAWCDADEALKIAHGSARDAGYDVIAADCMTIADTPQTGEETVEKPDGTVEKRKGDMLGHRKLRVETRLKLLAKWDPRRYGDKLQTELSGPDGGPVVMDGTARAARIAHLMAQAERRKRGDAEINPEEFA